MFSLIFGQFNLQNGPFLFPPGLEPGTFRVLGERDNHYTTETCGALYCTPCEAYCLPISTSAGNYSESSESGCVLLTGVGIFVEFEVETVEFS